MAMVGLGISWSRREVSMRERKACAFSSIVVPPNSVPSAIALTSPPAQKPRLAPVSTTAPTSLSSASRCSASSMASSMGPESAFNRSGRFMVSTATPSLMVSSRSVVIGDSSGRGDGPRSGRGGERSHVRHQRADLVVRQMIAEGGHTRPADGGPAVLDEIEHVVIREGRHGLPVPEIAGQEEESEDAAAHEEKTGRQDDEQPFRFHCWEDSTQGKPSFPRPVQREECPLSLSRRPR